MMNDGPGAGGRLRLFTREGSFARWQGITVTQLGYSINLVLTFAAATLGFSLTLIGDSSFRPDGWTKCLLSLSLLCLLASIAVGLLCVINRLRDFRRTAKIARDRETWEREAVTNEEIDRRLESRRAKTKKLGKRTWALFYWQTSLFVMGILLLVTAFVIVYQVKLLA